MILFRVQNQLVKIYIFENAKFLKQQTSSTKKTPCFEHFARGQKPSTRPSPVLHILHTLRVFASVRELIYAFLFLPFHKTVVKGE